MKQIMTKLLVDTANNSCTPFTKFLSRFLSYMTYGTENLTAKRTVVFIQGS